MTSPLDTVYYSYLIVGLLFFVFNKFFGVWVYRFVLMLTEKAQLSEAFLFRVDKKNRDSFFILTRVFSVALGLGFIGTSLFYLYM